MTERRTIVLMMLVPLGLWFACWPFVDSAVNDDFSYAFTARRLLETGRFTYNGWSSAMLVPQALWGAGFAFVFGFSHDILRASTIPFSAACCALTYLLHRRLGVSQQLSVFGTLLLVASPLFTAWSASFMTDIPGLFFTLLLFHAVIEAMRRENGRSILIAAVSIAAIGLLGGTLRQSLFAMALAGLAMTLLRHRYRRGVALGLIPVSAAYIALVILLVAWQARQPFAIRESLPTLAEVYERAHLWLFAFLLELCLYLLPLGMLLSRVAPVRRSVMIVLAVAMLSVAFGLDHTVPESVAAALFRALWLGNTLTANGLLVSNYDTPGYRPILFPDGLRILLGAAVFWVLSILIVSLHTHRSLLASHWRRLCREPWSERTWSRVSLLVIGIVYTTLLIPRAGLRLLFDRYLLVLIPIVTVLALSGYVGRLIGSRISRVAWILVAAYALIGVACTYDHFAELRARDRIASQLIREGVDRTQIANGFAFDAWTQLLTSGHINDPRIRQPADAYIAGLDPNRVNQFWFLNHTPAVQPRWFISTWPTRPAAPPGALVFSYRGAMPPSERWLVAWPVRSTTMPAVEPARKVAKE